MTMRFLLSIFVCLLVVCPAVTLASEINIRPFLIDKTMVPRESTTETIKLDNEYEFRKAVLFATVNEITVGEDGEVMEFVTPVMTDRTTSVTSWIEVTRGRIEIEPGGEIEIPLTIHVHPFAEPGEYHVFIGFVEASKRYLAEEVAEAGDAKGVVIKVTVADERTDTMRIAAMLVDRFVTNHDEQDITVTVENPGELPSAPVGEVIFYNSRGIEVAATPVNEAGATIAPGASAEFTVAVPEAADLGRFKANVALQYGRNQTASLYDTTSFFVVPLWYIISFLIGLTLLVLLFTVLFRRALSAGHPDEHGDEVSLFVRDGHDRAAQDHDIDLTTR